METVSIDQVKEAVWADGARIALGGAYTPDVLGAQVMDGLLPTIVIDRIPSIVPSLVPSLETDVVEEPPIELASLIEADPVPASPEVTKHNRLYTIRQMAAEVEPADCMVLVNVGEDELRGYDPSDPLMYQRTLLSSYFSHLHVGEYPIPAVGDYWIKHDFREHAEAVSEMHPDLVVLVKQLAKIGSDQLSARAIKIAEKTGLFLDVFLHSGAMVAAPSVTRLVRLTNPGIEVAEADRQAEILVQTQINHVKAQNGQVAEVSA